MRGANGERRDIVDGATRDADVPRLPAQTSTATARAHEVPPVPAEKDAHVHFVLFPFQPAKKTADPVVAVTSLDGELLLLSGQFSPRHLETELSPLRGTLEVRQLRAVVRLVPRLDSTLLDGLGRIRHNQIHVELDDVSKSVTRLTGTKWIVEREKTRLRILVCDGAGAAFKPLRKYVHSIRAWHVASRSSGTLLDSPRRSAALEV